MTKSEFKKLKEKYSEGEEKPHKYHASPKGERTCDGIIFDSKEEMERYLGLKWQKENGLIKDFKPQPSFDLILRVKYYADFEVIENDGSVHFEDVKGYETAEFKKKFRALKKQYPGLDIRILR